MQHRLYSFVNHLYMPPIQWGIQTAHCVSTMSRAYNEGSVEKQAYNEWADLEPTIIVAQGGNLANLKMLEETIKPLAEELQLPFASFREDEASLGGILTAVSVLMPAIYFDVVKDKYEPRWNGDIEEAFYCHTSVQGTLTSYTRYNEVGHPVEFKLIDLVKSARLA